MIVELLSDFLCLIQESNLTLQKQNIIFATTTGCV